MNAEERPWGEAHRREGVRCILRIFDRMAAAVTDVPPEGEMAVTMATLGSEETFRADLAALAADAPYITIDIDREVQRVRDLAEGRRVRETVWRRDEGPGYGDMFSTRELAMGGVGLQVTRVTRIRRAP